MLADTSYANAVLCEREGIDLVAPLPGKAVAEPPSADALTGADFEVSPREHFHVRCLAARHGTGVTSCGDDRPAERR
jgi:hypothetical protein